MESDKNQFNISLSQQTRDILEKTGKGTNLTQSDLIELIITQYFKTLQPDQEIRTA